jgi:leader peptidase (prepilin peptidase)/N-methyltransferase
MISGMAGAWHQLPLSTLSAVILTNLAGAFLSAAIYALADRGVNYLQGTDTSVVAHCISRSGSWPIYPAGAALGSLLIIQFGATPAALAGTLFCSALLALGLTDARTGYLPDIVTIPLLAIGLTVNLWPIFSTFTDAIAGVLAGYLVLWTINAVFFFLTGRQGMGYGDFKLLAAIGAWLGWADLPAVLLVASFSGLAVALMRRVAGVLPAGQAISFGPYLAMAGGLMLGWR